MGLIHFIFIMIGIITMSIYSFNYGGHDYGVYSLEVQGWEIQDLPLSWLIMKIFTSLFGNPEGLFYLNFVLSIICFFMFYYFYEDNYLDYLFPLIFFGNQALKYMVSGLVRNLLGFTIIIFFILNEEIDRYEFIKPIIIGLTHIPSLIIFIFYKTLKRENLRDIYLGLVTSLSILIVLAIYFKGEILQTLLKPIELILLKKKYFQFINIEFRGWSLYMFFILTFIIYSIDLYNKNKDKNVLIWIVFLIIPFIPLYTFTVMFRFILTTWLSISMILLSNNVSEYNYQKVYLFIVGIYSLVCRLP